MTTAIHIEISDEAAKAIMAGAVILGVGYLIYKLLENVPDDQIPLPDEARDFSELPEVSPESLEQLGFHGEVRDRAVPLLESGHNVAAVREASVALYDVIRQKSGANGDATNLVTTVFRGSNRILKFVNVAPNHITNAEDGLIGFLESFSKFTRKIQMHASLEMSDREALLHVNLAAFLAEQVEKHAVPAVEPLPGENT